MNLQKEVKKAQKGNVEAFERIISEYKLLMYRVSKAIVHHDEDCADVMQESILKAFDSIQTLKEPAYFKTWLMRIVKNESYQLIRKRKKVTTLENYDLMQSDDYGFEKVEVRQLLRQLPKEQAEILSLYYIEDLTIKDIAAIYDMPENTVKTRLRRAREYGRHFFSKKEGLQWKNGKTM
ncbi:RNA polymerase sigma factor [Salirhabdus sp. Marseille-P4669]|uniref:RNA polymerase sigma factor n=1 Tax=Salirhabdus sp. Marseille-P4669 TaxID=2042310 RepID=UPI000C7DA57A|nr:sigma-70 family RNA polymerase sigma factor [Salirhabdus sp. Marseille-P4669]